MKAMTIVMGILLTIGGVFCLTMPVETFLSLGWGFGVLLLIAGVELVINFFDNRKTGASSGWDLVLGILTVAVSVFFIYSPFAQGAFDLMLIYAIIAGLVVGGLLRIFAALGLKKRGGGKGWVWTLIFGIFLLLAGVIAIAFAFAHSILTAIIGAVEIGFIVGIYITVQGINTIVLGASMKKQK